MLRDACTHSSVRSDLDGFTVFRIGCDDTDWNSNCEMDLEEEMKWTASDTSQLEQFQNWLCQRGCLSHRFNSQLFYDFILGKLIILRDENKTIESRKTE